MAVSLRSQAKQATSTDIPVGLANLKGGVDEQGEYWLLPGSQEVIRCRREATKYAERMHSLIAHNLTTGKARTSLI